VSEISLRRDLGSQGITDDEIRVMVRAGSLQRLRRGAYVTPPDSEPGTRALEIQRRHRQLLAASVRQLSDQFVVSHMSAALLHGLPVWNDELGRLSLIRGLSGGGKTRADVLVRGLRLAPDEVVRLDDYRVTTVARTVLDLACSLSLERSVAVGDAALRRGLDPRAIADLVERARGRTGIGKARLAVELFDPRSESPGESTSRVIFHVRGLPTPELQYEVRSINGSLVGRSDVAWPELRTLGEFDGRTKYGELLQPGQTAGDVVFAEKVREDALRALGWQVVRWTWADLRSPDELIRRIERAFDRGRRG
jgi:hypothetical protein